MRQTLGGLGDTIMCDCDLITAYVEDLNKQVETMKEVYLFGSPEARATWGME